MTHRRFASGQFSFLGRRLGGGGVAQFGRGASADRIRLVPSV